MQARRFSATPAVSVQSSSGKHHGRAGVAVVAAVEENV
jgi:hypothetical protein